MKKFTGALLVVAGIVGSLITGADDTTAKVRNDVVVESQEVESNVGNGQEYAYEIVEIVGNEVYGKPLNKESYTNKGLYILTEEIGFDVKVGDNIVVIWTEYEDEFAFVDRAVYTKKHGYTSVTKLNIMNALEALRNRSKASNWKTPLLR